MRVIYSSGGPGGGGLWALPLLGGLSFIALGALIIVYPPVLAYAVAFLMIFVGLSLIGMALSWRSAFRGGGDAASADRYREWQVVDPQRQDRFIDES